MKIPVTILRLVVLIAVIFQVYGSIKKTSANLDQERIAKAGSIGDR